MKAPDSPRSETEIVAKCPGCGLKYGHDSAISSELCPAWGLDSSK